jgi:hypothetical protein
MPYEISLKNELCLRADLVPCAHFCRYCCISSKPENRQARITLSRFYALMDRFEEWGRVSGFSVYDVVHNSDDITDEVAAFLDETIGPPGTVHARPLTPVDARLRMDTVRTGGIRFRSDDEIREWLSRWSDTGSTIVHGSFAGHRESHNWWNNRQGDYDFLLRIQRIAVEMGFQISHTVFLTKKALHTLDALLDDLARLSAKPVNQWAFPPAYLGRARSTAAESHRITEDDRDHLLQNSALTGTYEIDKWKSEREQIHELKRQEGGIPSHGLNLYVDEGNIEYLESAPCEKIVRDLRSRVEAAYQSIPSSAELMTRYGDSNGMRIYGMQLELDSLWLDRCLRERDIPFERKLTHLH